MSFGRNIIIVFFLTMYISKMVKVGIVAIVGVEATKSGASVASIVNFFQALSHHTKCWCCYNLQDWDVTKENSIDFYPLVLLVVLQVVLDSKF
jgi:hypothetical protein